MRGDFGLVSGGVRDSGFGISLFRSVQVPSEVPSGLMQVDASVYFRDWGLFLAISRLSSWFKVGFLGACAWSGMRDFQALWGLEENS